MDLAIKRVLEKLVEGKISLEEAYWLLDSVENSNGNKKNSNKLTNNNNNFLTIRMF
jgi:hypothetical protein